MANTFPSTQVTYANAVANFSDQLDKALVQKSATGFFADNALGAKFVGAKSVSIPDISLQGLGDYDRGNGFVGGDITVARTVHTLTMDRGRTFHLDRMDEDEQSIANMIGAVSGEFVRTKVIPELDAYVLSKLAAKAVAKSHTVSVGGGSTLAVDCYKMFAAARRNVEEATGYNGDEIVAFVNKTFLEALDTSTAFTRNVVVSDFKKGDVTMKVRSIDGVTLIPVENARMYSGFDFLDGVDHTGSAGADETAGGFKPHVTTTTVSATTTSTVTHAGLIMCPRNIGGLVKKTEKLRVFSPDQNQKADAWKVDYRVYYDFFMKKSIEDTIYAYTYTETVS